MSDKEFPSCVYDVCAEFDCEETMALALIATRNELERTRKALDVAVDALKEIDKTRCGVDVKLYAVNHKSLNAGNVFCWTTIDDIHNALEQITALEQKESAFVHNKIEFPEFNDNLLEEFDKQFFEDGQDDI